jgi:hypothetical protein
MKTILFIISHFIFCGILMAQEPPAEMQRLNSIKLEISQPLYPRSLLLSYERITKPNESFCVTAGYEEFPPIINFGSTIRVKEDMTRTGFRVGTEYRFYLKKENRHAAPHGTYLGPYFAYHYFYNKRNIAVKVTGAEEFAELQSDFHIMNLGIQLGHQFVFNNRWTLDVVAIGPCVSNYKAQLKLNGQFTFDKDEIQNEIILKILDRFPMLEKILTDKEVSSQGKFDNWSYGWRAQLQIGYHFGRKRKLPANE